MKTQIKAFLLRALRRNAGPITEAQLVTMTRGTFLEATDSDARAALDELEADQLAVASRVPVLETKQFGLTAAGASAAAALR